MKKAKKPSVKAFMDKWGWDWFDIDNVKHDEAEMRRDLLALLRAYRIRHACYTCLGRIP